jgi:formiminotetrahydrofolate cyclodeaminase
MDYDDRTVAEFLADVASARVAPAGGSAGALVGAIGTACCEMVCLHLEAAAVATDADLEGLQTELEGCRDRLLALGAADAAVVEALFGPDGDPDRATRKRAIGVPLALAETCLTAQEAAVLVTAAADRPVVADALTGSYVLEAAVRSAVATARGNLAAIDEEPFRIQTERRLTDVATATDRAVAAVRENVDVAA